MNVRCLLLPLALGVAGQALAESTPTIDEWPVPWENTRPRDPSVAPDGRVWFVGQTGNYLAVFDPTDAAFARFELPPDTRPHTVVVAPDGKPWVAGNGNGTLLRYGPDGVLRERLEVPQTEGVGRRDPHTFAFDGHGGLWFTMQQGNALGHLDLATGTIRVAPVATAQARPYGIVATPDGDAWAVLFGVGKLLRATRADLRLTEIALPRPLARPRRLDLDASGAVWYVDYAGGFLGRHDPADGSTREWPMPSTPSAPYAMAVAEGRAWLFESAPQPNLLQVFALDTERFVAAVAVPSGAGTVRHAAWDASRKQLWFGTDRNTLGRVNTRPGS